MKKLLFALVCSFVLGYLIIPSIDFLWTWLIGERWETMLVMLVGFYAIDLAVWAYNKITSSDKNPDSDEASDKVEPAE